MKGNPKVDDSTFRNTIFLPFYLLHVQINILKKSWDKTKQTMISVENFDFWDLTTFYMTLTFPRTKSKNEGHHSTSKMIYETCVAMHWYNIFMA